MIALDIDGVLADSATQLRFHLIEELGLQVDDIGPTPTEYSDFASQFPERTHEQVREIAARCFASGEGQVYSNALIMPGSSNGANWLARRGLLKGYVTRRPARTRAQTKNWLREHGFPNAPLEHAPDGEGKADYAKKLKATVMIEDNPTELEALSEAGLSVIVMDWPYNRALEHPHVRVSDWFSLLELLKRIPIDYRVKREKRF